MQIAQGEPGAIVWDPLIGKTGLFPIAGLAFGSNATSIVICRRNFPSLSNSCMRRRPGLYVSRVLLASENHGYTALGIKFDDHVRALVGHPDVILLIDLDGVRIRPGVQVVANFSQELPLSVELQQLCRSGSVSRAGRVAARQDENVPLGIDRHSSGFTEIQMRWKFQGIRNRLELDLRLLRKEGTGHVEIQ